MLCIKRCLHNFFCCGCCKKSPLINLNEVNTKLLPKNELTIDLIEKNELFSFGSVPDNVRLFDLTNFNSLIKKIVIGKNHCLILFENGQLFGFGGNEEGQLGMNINENKFDSLTLIRLNNLNFNNFIINNPIVEDIAAGENFSIILIRDSDNNQHLIRFGIKLEDKYNLDENNINEFNIKVINLETIPNYLNNEIDKIFAFGKRIIFTTKKNENNNLNNLNKNNINNQNNFSQIFIGGIDFNENKIKENTYIELIENNNINFTNVFLGQNFCLLFDKISNKIFGIGDNTYSEMTKIKTKNDKFKELPIKFNIKIIKISVGARHCLFLLENGDVYVLGDNSEGQCCGMDSQINVPKKLEIHRKEKIQDIYCGYTHNFIVLENGSVLSWGDASMGKLGYDEEQFTQSVPKEIICLNEKCVCYVSLGFQMSVVITGKKKDSIVEKNKNVINNVMALDKIDNL